ncbi:DUF1304 domain-containing protein [Leuconostoc suionicum]|uniref:DUF1304 domain-containing protein n=1 Tax=Leuconostoc suionicum TaxID=1511761 RepID=UPI0037C0174F
MVGLEFFYSMFLGTFATISKATSKTYNLSSEELANKNVQVLFKNQGICNGLLYYIIFFIMLYITIVELYGSIPSGNKPIVFKQAGLAILTIILLFVFH